VLGATTMVRPDAVVMSPWQVALRCAAYLVLLALSLQWLSAAAPWLQEQPFDADARLIDDTTIALGAVLGFKHEGTLWLAASLISIKPMIGFYLLLTVMLAACSWAAHGKADPARLDAGLLLCVFAIMFTAAPGLIALHVMPGTIDDLTVAVIGISFAALSRPEFLSEQPAAQPATATG
jgi:hypothetical protein